ncbi:1-acylglycerol-3-phosphate acyltransferase [Niveomyces insectorum RCEF 264]|uniref:1-acylglycerol-3-phosphate acyltransferase n=1 Tax=Niveomyces insectorum RCEF 264 TaxID=1081102 RepID=A0A167RH64_9HYPO|nr:1-acylglycerol-3-phosphate acyltransferase [Niveomyces insectorum RCEF 264]
MVAYLSAAAEGLAWFLVRYTGVVVVLYLLATVSALAGFAARMLAAWLALVVCSLYGVAASVALRLAGGGRWQLAQYATARAFKYTMATLTGITFAVEDPHGVLATTRPAVFIGNHQTALDVLMLGCMFPRYCSDARAALRGAADAIRTHRQSVYMFPEGTRSNALEPMLLPFKKGAFHLAVQAGVPIVPVAVANYSHLYNTSKLRFLPGRIPIKVLDPISTEGLTADDVADLTTRVRDLMLQEVVALTAQARAESASKAAVAVPAAPPPAKATDKAVASGVDTTSL